MNQNQDFVYSYYAIRKIIGVLGMALPVAVYLGYGKILASISHYYYTQSAVFFIAILSAFGLFLISYRGYRRDKQTEWISDNVITHVGGIAAIIVVLIPTSCLESGSAIIDAYCANQEFPLFGHCDSTLRLVHLLSAGVFFISMGYLSIFRFTKGIDSLEKRRKNRIYRTCGWIMWACIALLLLSNFISRWVAMPFYMTYLFETIAIFSFGISWLVKGEAIKDVVTFGSRIFRKKM